MSAPLPIEEFPFGTRLSLAHLIDFWERQAADASAPDAPLARVIVEKLEKAPELRGIIEDRSVLEAHHELVELLMTAVVPAGRRDDYCCRAPSQVEDPWHSR